MLGKPHQPYVANSAGNPYGGASPAWISSLAPPAPLVQPYNYNSLQELRHTALPPASSNDAQAWLDWASIRG